MVCLPCFIVPVLLFLWHKFIQPYVLRFWNPWAVKDDKGNVIHTEFPFACEGGVCAYKRKKDEDKTSSDNDPVGESYKEPQSCPSRQKAD